MLCARPTVNKREKILAVTEFIYLDGGERKGERDCYVI